MFLAGNVPLNLQAKLLRVLETGEFERVGSSKTHKVDARVKNRRRRELLVLDRKRRRAARRQRGSMTGGLAETIWKPPEVN